MQTIIVAGATGNLGGRIVKALEGRGANVRALVRRGSPPEKLAKLGNAEVVEVDVDSASDLINALQGGACVVSALQGLRDVIVGTQTALVEAAVAAGVPRFIPSDFATDFTQIPAGENRNFDLRREFHGVLGQSGIAATSIMNGAFAEVLLYGSPLLDLKGRSVSYWDRPDVSLDFTSMDDTAAFTAAAALDDSSPRILRIAGFQISPQDLAAVAGRVLGAPFSLVHAGSREDLAAQAKKMRAANPKGEEEVFPDWQRMQYTHSMFSVQMSPLDNERYPELKWTGAEEFLRQNLREVQQPLHDA